MVRSIVWCKVRLTWWLRQPGVRSWWKSGHPGYCKSFTEYIDREMGRVEADSTQAKAVADSFFDMHTISKVFRLTSRYSRICHRLSAERGLAMQDHHDLWKTRQHVKLDNVQHIEFIAA